MLLADAGGWFTLETSTRTIQVRQSKMARHRESEQRSLLKDLHPGNVNNRCCWTLFTDSKDDSAHDRSSAVPPATGSCQAYEIRQSMVQDVDALLTSLPRSQLFSDAGRLVFA
jgi:hypothetical protein